MLLVYVFVANCSNLNLYIYRRVGESILINHGNSTDSSTPNNNTTHTASADPIQEILVLQEKLVDILKQCFHSQDVFKNAYRSAFEYFLNSSKIPATPGTNSNNCSNNCANKVSELLAKYFDKKLRSGSSGVSGSGHSADMEIENQLNKCFQLFGYMNAKDIFEAFHRKYLSRRLLLNKSSSDELEKYVISKLKAECGANYTSKLDGMFADMELSKDVMVYYNQYVATKKCKLSIDLSVQVFTTGFWPTPLMQFSVASNINPSLYFHADIQASQNQFIEFYNNKYQGRRLTWSYSNDRCLVTARFPKGK